ncbi:MAG TPA: DNA polymerase III subunit gamma/tau [Acidobacteriaceae bacterium]
MLARKYRPQRFSDVAGQDHVTRTLLNALAQGRIAHGYIFSGHRGIGKTTIARILAMALNCRTAIGSAGRPSPEPREACESCTEVRAGNAVDVIEIDAATNRGIDEIRELRDAARYRPARDRYKIYILDEAHQITDAAFNALLKTLEEPPDHVVFMMATTQPEDIPQTIRSRCQHFSFHAVKFDDILIQLHTIAAAERVRADDEALALLAEAGDGSMRDALSIMDQAIASAAVVEGEPQLEAAQIRELMGTVANAVFERLLEAIGENQSGPVVEEINRLLNAGNSASQLARQFVRYLRNVLMARIAGAASELLQLSPDERARAGRSALLFSEEDLTRFLQVMLRTFDELNYRQEPRFHLELGLLKLVHLQRLLPVEQLLSQIGPLPGPVAGRAGARSSEASRGAGSASAAGPAAPAAGEASAAPGMGRGATALPGREAPVPAADKAPGRPAFSPFESDSRRKGNEPAEAAAVPGRVTAAEAPSTESPRIAEQPAARLAKEENPQPSEAAAPAATGSGSGENLGEIKAQVCAALDAAGHNTAAALLGNGVWTHEATQAATPETSDARGGILRVEVAAKKTMLGLTMNAEAEKICRETLRSIAAGRQPATLVVVPQGASPESPGGSKAAALANGSEAPPPGSLQSLAMENPLVKQAQELFRAEVRSVLDLRTPDRRAR